MLELIPIMAGPWNATTTPDCPSSDKNDRVLEEGHWGRSKGTEADGGSRSFQRPDHEKCVARLMTD